MRNFTQSLSLLKKVSSQKRVFPPLSVALFHTASFKGFPSPIIFQREARFMRFRCCVVPIRHRFHRNFLISHELLFDEHTLCARVSYLEFYDLGFHDNIEAPLDTAAVTQCVSSVLQDSYRLCIKSWKMDSLIPGSTGPWNSLCLPVSGSHVIYWICISGILHGVQYCLSIGFTSLVCK